MDKLAVIAKIISIQPRIRLIRSFDEVSHARARFKVTNLAYGVRPPDRVVTGEDWRDSIKEALISCRVAVLIITPITPNYKSSEICQKCTRCSLGNCRLCFASNC